LAHVANTSARFGQRDKTGADGTMFSLCLDHLRYRKLFDQERQIMH